MNIRLKNLTLKNFKGLSNFSVDFTDRTVISGDNGTGKTTISDAWSWLLFGKDTTDRKDFQIKPLDENNVPLSKVETEVSALIDVDNADISIKRILREKWVKPRGEAEAVFQGNETIYFWNDVPHGQAEFKAKIESLVNENVFKMITSPSAFVSINWKDQRSVLFNMAGSISDESILDAMMSQENADAVVGLAKILESKKSFDEYKREIGSRKKKLSDELKAIPTRIDEINRNMPVYVDTEETETRIAKLTATVSQLEKQITDKSAGNEATIQRRIKKQNEIEAINIQIRKLKDEATDAVTKANRTILSKYDDHSAAIIRMEAFIKNQREMSDQEVKRIKAVEGSMETLRADYRKVNSETIVFNESDTCCPTCKRELDNAEARKDELTANFNNDKRDKLAKINKDGEAFKSQIESKQEKVLSIEQVIANQQEELEALKANRPSKQTATVVLPPEVDALEKDAAKLKKELDAINVPSAGTDEFAAHKRQSETEIQNLKASLVTKEIRKDNLKRISELEEQGKNLGQEIATLERSEFHILEFTKRKIEAVESRINSNFKVVRFKMYKQLINGGEEECCEALVDGVPISDVNHAGKINAGIDIINALSKFYEVSAPVWIDNSESINVIWETSGQMILLEVSKEPLTIVN